MDAARLRGARRHRRRDPEPHAVRPAPRDVRVRRHVRDELRVRLRLPPRQHGRDARGHCPEGAHVRDRGRGRLDPHRRGAHAAHHLRRAGDGREDVLRLRAGREAAGGRPLPAALEDREARRARRRLHVRREVQDRLAAAARHREGRARARDREPLRPAQRPARQPPLAGAEGAGALQPRQGIRHRRRRGEDRRRVHRPDHGRPPLVGRPPPGRRGQGGRGHPGGARHHGDDHAPELLPPLRQARRDDRYREDRGEGVLGDLRAPRRGDPDEC